MEKNSFIREFDCVPLNDQNYTLPNNSFQTNNKGNIRNICNPSNNCQKLD
jgi:hypothetical protein